MEHVGLTERLTMQREGNSMRQWKRRQRDWQRVSLDVAAKTGKVSKLQEWVDLTTFDPNLVKDRGTDAMD